MKDVLPVDEDLLFYVVAARCLEERTFYKPRRGKKGPGQVWTIQLNPRETRVVICRTGTYLPGRGAALKTVEYPQKSRNMGKANFKPPEQVAEELYQRRVREKVRAGYVEIPNLAHLEKEAVNITLDHDQMPDLLALDVECPSFRVWKPQNTLRPGSSLWKKVMTGSALCVEKKDGMGCIVVKDRGQFAIYSLNIQQTSPLGGTILDRLPLVEVWLDIASPLIPDGTMFLCEIIPIDEDHPEPFQYVTSIMKSYVEVAEEKQEQNGFLGLYIWDLAIWAHVPVARLSPYHDRLGTVADLVQSVECCTPNRGIGMALAHGAGMNPYEIDEIELIEPPIAVFEASPLAIPTATLDPIQYLKDLALEAGWEGFVVSDGQAVLGKRAWSFHGRPERPSSVAKVKPKLEDDFIAMWGPEGGHGEYGTGKNRGKIGAVDLFQWGPEDLHYCGQCGVGFSQKERAELIPLLREGPVVFQIEFHRWTPNGQLLHPSFQRIREDKPIEDCNYSGPGLF